LEDKVKQHLIFPYDPDFVESMNKPDWDPHLEIAKLAEMLTQEQVDKYKSGEDKSIKPIRDIAKNGNYACQYNAGPSRLARTCGISLEQASVLHKAYWKMNHAIKTVVSKQKFKEVNGQLWLFNPISSLWYSLRYERDIFSTLVQSTGAYIFDIWLQKILYRREQLNGSFHDEFILTIKEGFEGECTKMIEECMEEVNTELKFDVKLSCGIQYGKKYSEIH
jgi:DNA polymerase I-like protein with 3'-5' exonuclease and polymerase domains